MNIFFLKFRRWKYEKLDVPRIKYAFGKPIPQDDAQRLHKQWTQVLYVFPFFIVISFVLAVINPNYLGYSTHIFFWTLGLTFSVGLISSFIERRILQQQFQSGTTEMTGKVTRSLIRIALILLLESLMIYFYYRRGLLQILLERWF